MSSGEALAARIIDNAENLKKGQGQHATFEAKQELAKIKETMIKNFDKFAEEKSSQTDDLQQYTDAAKTDII